MHGFRVFLAKEFKEIARTWRIWVLPAIVIGLGVMSPVIAEITPDLIESLATDQPGLTIEIPDPTMVDAYLQFSKNLQQIVLIAVVIAVAGMVAGERKDSTTTLMLTKPLSREGFVVAKVIGNWVLVIGATIVGALVCWGGAQFFFEDRLVGEFARLVGLWLLLAMMVVGIMALLSAALNSQGGAAGAGVAVYLVLSILSQWGPARDYSPAGLVTLGDRLLLGKEAVVLWPVLTTTVVTFVAVAAAALVFRRQEI